MCKQHCRYCGEDIPGGNRARHYKTRHAGVAQTGRGEQIRNSNSEEPKRVSEWLEITLECLRVMMDSAPDSPGPQKSSKAEE
jgi:hypothetical protein